MYLSDLTPLEQYISYGNLGVNGSQGYEIIPSVNGQNYNHVISAHASSILKYNLNKEYKSFHSYIALNDSSSFGAEVIFEVYCDGHLAFTSSKVAKFDKLRPVNISVEDVDILELRCINKGDNIAHSLWIDACCTKEKLTHHIGPFNNTSIELSFPNIKSKYASIVFASENMAKYLYAFLKTFQKNSKLNDCINYIVIVEESFVIRKIAKHFGAVVIKSNKTKNYINSSAVDLKDSVYSIAKHINAEFFVISDIDILVNRSLEDCFIPNKLGICRDANTDECTFGDLVTSEWSAYKGEEKYIDLLEITKFERDHKDILNCGFISGPKKQFMILEDELRKMLPESQFYLCFNNGAGPREQALINLALLRSNNYRILDYSFNHQLLWMEPKENALLHLNAPETKKIYKNLVDEQCDDSFQNLNKNLFQDYLEINNFKNILCIGNLGYEEEIENTDFVSLKKISKIENTYDCVIYDHFDDMPNTKIKLYLINKILKEGKIVVLTSKENLETFNLLGIEYELLGTDFEREILIIEK